MAEYCLRWNNHQPNLVTVFSELLNAESLVDVTLATDGHYIHAHKLVLSACSAYFKDLFGSNPCKHPIVFLKDIRIDDLRTVIDFIYRGEVNVAQERLQDVLKTAESLRIKGLADKPFNYEEYPSQSRGQKHSSSFSSQKSSLTDSRELQQSGDNEDSVDPAAPSSPANKKRKLTSQESGDKDSSHENDDVQRSESGDEESIKKTLSSGSVSVTPVEPTEQDSGPKKTNSEDSGSVKEKIKEEDESGEASTTDLRAEFQESRAADAMLMLQGSNSDGGDDGGSNPLSSRSGDSSFIGSHSQGKSKRAMLQRQLGITREAIPDDQQTPYSSSFREYILESCPPTRDTTMVSRSTQSPGTHTTWSSDNSTSTVSATSLKMLQVPTVVVGTHPEKPHEKAIPYSSPYSLQSQKSTSYSKPLLTVPSTCSGTAQIIRQRSQPEMSRSLSEGVHPLVKHDYSHSDVCPTTMISTSDPTTSSDTSQSMTLIPMQLIKKQRSSPGSLTSTPSHLRPIQPKPFSTTEKELPLIQFSTTDEGASYVAKFPRAISEEPLLARNIDFLSVTGTAALTQSVSHDTGLDGGAGFVERILSSSSQCLTIPKSSVSSAGTPTESLSGSSPLHTPVLREGPALGCNFCWNSHDNHGRVQRRKTKYHCPACRTNLCIVPCFHKYHSQVQMQQDQNKQYAKVLTKTSST